MQWLINEWPCLSYKKCSAIAVTLLLLKVSMKSCTLFTLLETYSTAVLSSHWSKHQVLAWNHIYIISETSYILFYSVKYLSFMTHELRNHTRAEKRTELHKQLRHHAEKD